MLYLMHTKKGELITRLFTFCGGDYVLQSIEAQAALASSRN